MCLQVVKHKYECEIQGSLQHLEVTHDTLLSKYSAQTQNLHSLLISNPHVCVAGICIERAGGWNCANMSKVLSLFVCCASPQSERVLLFDAMKTELLDKIHRLEEDRQSIDITSGTMLCTYGRRKSTSTQTQGNYITSGTCANSETASPPGTCSNPEKLHHLRYMH